MRTYFIKTPQWARLIYPQAIWTSKWHEENEQICWTFDDGPHPESTPLLLKALDQMMIKATFFLSGRRCIQYPELVELIKDAGHRVGAHGYEHLDGWRTSRTNYVEDAYKSLEIVDTPLFRPPFGRMTYRQYAHLSSMAEIMMWSIMPGDFDQSISVNQLISRCQKIKYGDIVVLHDSPQCIDRISSILRRVDKTSPLKG